MTEVPLGKEAVMTHREIPVQVTAWVDEGVAELVAALNTVPGVLTLDSCQEDKNGLASVMFCTHDETLLYETVSLIAQAVGEGRRDRVTISLWWGSDDAPAVADLACPPGLVSAVADAVRSNADHMTEFSRDSARRELHSSTARRHHPWMSPSCGGTPPLGHDGSRA